jgi:Uma2 family endonuclease
MAAVLERQTNDWTYEKYCQLDDDKRYEIIDGNLLMAPAPTLWHAQWSFNLAVILREHATRRNLGTIFVAPVDVVLDDRNVVQPDIIFVASANKDILHDKAIVGVPDLLVEMISPSSVRRDRYQKKDLYARFGVKEYWIGDPGNESLEVFSLKQNGYESLCSAEQKGKIFSHVLTGFEFDLSQLQSR